MVDLWVESEKNLSVTSIWAPPDVFFIINRASSEILAFESDFWAWNWFWRRFGAWYWFWSGFGAWKRFWSGFGGANDKIPYFGFWHLENLCRERFWSWFGGWKRFLRWFWRLILRNPIFRILTLEKVASSCGFLRHKKNPLFFGGFLGANDKIPYFGFWHSKKSRHHAVFWGIKKTPCFSGDFWVQMIKSEIPDFFSCKWQNPKYENRTIRRYSASSGWNSRLSARESLFWVLGEKFSCRGSFYRPA